MEQGSPPSPRTRDSMLGSAFAAVKNYFTPERNQRPNEGTGITPLVRSFATLTLGDSPGDTTDSFKTCCSTPDQNELSFQVPQHLPGRVDNVDAIEAILFKESPENADDTIEPNLGSLDESHQSDWSFLSDPGEMSIIGEESPAAHIHLKVNNVLTPIKEVVEGSFCSEVSVSPNQTIITTLPAKSDVEISKNTNDLLDSHSTLQASTDVCQHVPGMGDSSSHSLPENQGDKIDQGKEQPEIISIVDAEENPCEEVEEIVDSTLIQDGLEGSLPCDVSMNPNQAIIITVTPSKTDLENSTQSNHVEFSPTVSENNKGPDPVPELRTDRVTYAHAFEAFLSNSLKENSDLKEENLERDSLDGDHQQDCSLELSDPEEELDAREEVPKNEHKFLTPIQEVLEGSLSSEAFVHSDQTIEGSTPPKPDPEMSVSGNNLIDSAQIMPENNEDCTKDSKLMTHTLAFAADVEAILSREFAKNLDDELDLEQIMETDSLDGNLQPVEESQDVIGEENPAELSQIDVNGVILPIQEVLKVPPKSDDEVSIVGVDSSLVAAEKNEGSVQVTQLVADEEHSCDQIEPDKKLETTSLDGENQPEYSVPLPGPVEVSKSEENPAEQLQSNDDQVLTPMKDPLAGSLCPEASANPNQTTITLLSPKSDAEVSILGNQLVDFSLLAAEKNEGSIQVDQLVADEENSCDQIEPEQKLETTSLDGENQPEYSVPLPGPVEVSKSEENPAEQLQSNDDQVLTPIEDSLAGSLCTEASANPNQTTITLLSPKSDTEISVLGNQLADFSLVAAEKNEGSVQVTQLVADEENSCDQIEPDKKLETTSLDGENQPEYSVPLPGPVEVSKSEENPAEQLQSNDDQVLTPIEDSLAGSLCTEASANTNQTTITLLSPKSDTEISVLGNQLADFSLIAAEKNEGSIQVAQLVADEEHSCDQIEPEQKLEMKSFDEKHESEYSVPVSHPEEVLKSEESPTEQLQSNDDQVLTPIKDPLAVSLCPEAAVTPNQTIITSSDAEISETANCVETMSSQPSPENADDNVDQTVANLQSSVSVSTPEEVSTGNTEEKTSEQLKRNENDFLTPLQKVSEISLCSEASVSRNQVMKSDTSKLENHSMDSPSNDLIVRKGKIMVESTPQPAGIAGRIAKNNMSDVSPIVACLPEPTTDSPYTQCFLDEAMIHSTPDVILERSEDENASEKLASEWNFLEQAPANTMNAVLNETKTLHTSETRETEPLNETKTLPTMVNSETKVVPSSLSVLNETKTLQSSVISETENLPNPAFNETKILDYRFDETRTLFKDPEMNSTVTLSNNLDHTVKLTKAVDKANMTVTRILMNDDFNNSLIATVSPFSCKNISRKAASPDGVLFADLNDEPRENWNMSIVNKSKNSGCDVLREINDNVLDNNMGAWFSGKANSPDKINQNLSIAHFEMFNTAKLQQPPKNRESFFINFDPCYQPKGLLDSSSVNSAVGNKAAALDLMGLEMSTESNEEKLQKEIDRLRALYDEREQVAQLKLQEIQAKNDAVEKECVDARKTLAEIEESNLKKQRELQHLGKSNVKLAYASETYQKAVEVLRADLSKRLEMERPGNPATLAAERDSYQQHLKSAEAAFVDVLAKYEKMRKSVQDLKKSVTQREKESADLRRECDRLDETIRDSETTAKTSFENLQRKAREEQDQYSSDVSRITAQLRKSELSLKHIQDSYDKTVTENEKIAALCDDIIAGKS